MNITVSIPDAIYSAIQQGVGRVWLQRRFDLSQLQARYYIHLVEKSQHSEEWKTAFIIADLHVPYHVPSALKRILDYGQQENPNTLIILGDLVDFYRISFWKKDPSRMRFADEIECCKETLKEISKCFPDAEKILFEGNHCYRLTPYLWSQAQELYGLEELTVPELLHLGQWNWKYIPTTKHLQQGGIPYQLGDLFLLHGHEVRCSRNSVNIPRNYLYKVGRHLLVAHHHQTQDYLLKTIDQQYIHAHSMGCICQLNPNFALVNNWNWGYCIVKWNSKSGQFLVENKRL